MNTMESRIVKENAKGLELKKHVATIHSSNKLSLVERKIVNALLHNAYDNLLTQDEHSIHIKKLCELIGYDSKDYKLIKKALVSLLSTVIEWNLIDGEKIDSEAIWNASSIIADASIDGHICTYSYSNKMKKLLYNPEVYGRLNLQVQAQFNSSYGLALYENCIRYQRIDRTPWLEMEKFRRLMGVSEKEYLQFKDFKKRVINKAVEEVNKYSPIMIEPKFKKENRKVIAIQFSINPNKKLEDEMPLSAMDLQQKLKNVFAFSTQQIEKILSAYDKDYILHKIKLVEESSSFQQGKINNLARYLMQAIAEDYQPAKSSITLAVQPKAKSVKTTPIEHDMNALFEQFLAMDENEKNIFMQAFEKEISKSVYWKLYLKEGIHNILVKEKLTYFFKYKTINL